MVSVLLKMRGHLNNVGKNETLNTVQKFQEDITIIYDEEEPLTNYFILLSTRKIYQVARGEGERDI